MAIDFTIEFSGLCAVVLDKYRKNADVLLVAAERTDYSDDPHWAMLTFDLDHRKSVSKKRAYSTVMLPGKFGKPVGVMKLKRQVLTLHPDGKEAAKDQLKVGDLHLPKQEEIFQHAGEVDPKYLKDRPPKLISARISLGEGCLEAGKKVDGPWSFYPKNNGKCYSVDGYTDYFTNHFVYKHKFDDASALQIRAVRKTSLGKKKTTTLELEGSSVVVAISNLPPVWNHNTHHEMALESGPQHPRRHSRAFFDLARQDLTIQSEDDLPLTYNNGCCKNIEDPMPILGAGDIGCSPRELMRGD